MSKVKVPSVSEARDFTSYFDNGGFAHRGKNLDEYKCRLVRFPAPPYGDFQVSLGTRLGAGSLKNNVKIPGPGCRANPRPG